MDAETYLRRQAEIALRIPGSEYDKTRRFEPVRRALTMSGALDAATADAIDADLRLAAQVRQPREKPRLTSAFRQFGSRMSRISARAVRASRLTATASTSLVPAPSTAVMGWSATTSATALASPAVPAAPAASGTLATAPDRAIPLEATLPIRSGELHGELHLLSYVHYASGARLTYAGPVLMKAGRAFRSLRQLTFTAADDQGNAYTLRFGSSSMSSDHWGGELTIQPDPPPGIRWLNIGEPPVRVELAGGPAADISVTPATLSRAEHYLHRLAAGLLAGHLDPGDALTAAAALLAVGVLAPDNQVLAGLSALAAGRPGTDLPEHWRLAPEPMAPARRGYAGLAAVLPDIDSTRISLLGLHTDDGAAGTAIQVHVAITEWHDQMPWLLWLRDAAGWHVTGQWSGGGSDTEMRLQYPVIPPLRPGDWIEVLVVGQSAEVRARVPVRWRVEGNA